MSLLIVVARDNKQEFEQDPKKYKLKSRFSVKNKLFIFSELRNHLWISLKDFTNILEPCQKLQGTLKYSF